MVFEHLLFIANFIDYVLQLRLHGLHLAFLDGLRIVQVIVLVIAGCHAVRQVIAAATLVFVQLLVNFRLLCG